MRIKSSVVLASAIALIAGGWIVSGQFDDATPPARAGGQEVAAVVEAPAAPIMRVQVADLRAAERVTHVVVQGRSAANRRVTVRAETKGRIVEIAAERGSQVAAGDVLVRIANDDRDARLRREVASVKQREIEYTAAKELSRKGFRSDTSLAKALAELQAAMAEVEIMRIDIERLTVRAPFDGVLETRPVELGDFVDTGDEIAMIVDLDPALVIAEVSEREVGQLRLGRIGSGRLVTGEAVEGTVRFIGSVADPVTRTFTVEVEVPNADRSVLEGVTTELRFPVEQVPAHRVSPSVLTLDAKGAIGVKLVDAENRVRFYPVRIIADTPEGVWLADLPSEIRLIVVGQEFVFDGQVVEPVAADAPKDGGAA